MPMTQVQAMFCLLRRGMGLTEGLSAEECAAVSEQLEAACRLADKHGLLHLVAYAVETEPSLTVPPSLAQVLQRSRIKAIVRHEQLQYEYDRLCAALDELGLPYVPLKGAVMRDYYPEPWMRNSCDVDVLFHREHLLTVTDHLRRTLQYVGEDEVGLHDIPMRSCGGLTVELHYRLTTVTTNERAKSVLESVWEQVTPEREGDCRGRMSDEMFYLYHIAHMARHIENGGCGVRPFLDLWLLEHRVDHEDARRNDLLDRCGLRRFADVCRRVAQVWFSDAAHDQVTRQVEQVILECEAFGSLETAVAIRQQMRGGKWKYALYRVFPPYAEICVRYPILQRHRWLTPLAHIRRWGEILLDGTDRRRSVGELTVGNQVDKEQKQAMADFVRHIGL